MGKYKADIFSVIASKQSKLNNDMLKESHTRNAIGIKSNEKKLDHLIEINRLDRKKKFSGTSSKVKDESLEEYSIYNTDDL